jgi:hypothetical protein
MSLIDTLAPVILAVGFIICVLLWSAYACYHLYTERRTKLYRAKTDYELDQKYRLLVRDLVTQVDCDPLLKDAMPTELQDRAWELHEKNYRRELSQ